MKDLLKNIWNKIKEYKTYAILFLCILFVAFINLITNFDLIKLITYVILFAMLLYNIVVYIKIKDSNKK